MTRIPLRQLAENKTPVRIKRIDDYTFVKKLAKNELKEAEMNVAYTKKQYDRALEKVEKLRCSYEELCSYDPEKFK